MNTPLISIITIVYNNKNSIEDTIKSVKNQTYSNIEYIIIDGGSTDGTIDIINKFKIDRLVSEPDLGISDAFNKGIKLANGQLIGLINSGDSYELDAVENIVSTHNQITEQLNLNNVLVVYHGNIRMNSPEKSKIYTPKKLNSFVYQMPIWHPTIFASKNVYAKFKYDTRYKIAMDYDLFSRVYNLQSKFIYVNKLISNMNVDGISNYSAKKGFYEVMIASRLNLKISRIRSFVIFFMRCGIFDITTTLKKQLK